MKKLSVALIYWQSDENSTLSYQHGWPNAMQQSTLFEVVHFNLHKMSWLDRFDFARRLQKAKVQAIILLHSTFSNQQNLRGLVLWVVSRSSVPKAYFIGNEYKHMPEKLLFAKKLGISLLLTQSNDNRVLSSYREALGCAVNFMPNTGIDTKIFYSQNCFSKRSIDIGYRAYESSWYLGNDEKKEIADYFKAYAIKQGLIVDISLDPKDRFDAKNYANFLNNCRGQIGTEAGGDYFELTDITRNKVNHYLSHNKQASWTDVKLAFFDHYGPAIPMRIISGRQVEAAACMTVQILFDGKYGGFFQPDNHYISLNKNFSNINEVMLKFNDVDYCSRITANAYDVIMGEFTYETLAKKFHVLINSVI
ncbi:hypothetical protein MCEHALH13_00877 [Candidatus Methylopumilus universalis]|uniref:hypothetical protein n=1 Tax=Candidatus Methylopumilus universalis TaxID=2588536 RepID=UPI003BEEDE53